MTTFPDASVTSPHALGGVPLDGGLRADQVRYRSSPSFRTPAPDDASSGVLVR